MPKQKTEYLEDMANMKDLAKVTALSLATISRVFNGKELITGKT